VAIRVAFAGTNWWAAEALERLSAAPGLEIVHVVSQPDRPAGRGRKPGGAHGYAPMHPELLASFLFAGPGVRSDASLGEIDMRNIAPTLAAYLGVKFTTADLPALDIFTRR